MDQIIRYYHHLSYTYPTVPAGHLYYRSYRYFWPSGLPKFGQNWSSDPFNIGAVVIRSYKRVSVRNYKFWFLLIRLASVEVIVMTSVNFCGFFVTATKSTTVKRDIQFYSWCLKFYIRFYFIILAFCMFYNVKHQTQLGHKNMLGFLFWSPKYILNRFLPGSGFLLL